MKKYSRISEIIRRRKAFILAMVMFFGTLIWLTYASPNVKIDNAATNAVNNATNNEVVKEIIVEITYAQPTDYGYTLTCNTACGRVKLYGYTELFSSPESDQGTNPESNQGTKQESKAESKSVLYAGLIGEYGIVNLKYGLEIPEPASNPGCFDNRKYLYGQGIKYTGQIVGFTEIPDNAFDYSFDYTFDNAFDDTGFSAALFNTNRNIYLRAKRHLIIAREQYLDSMFPAKYDVNGDYDEFDDFSRGLAKGILFGDTSEIPEETYKSFQGNNTAHILAVSGLHIGIIYQVYRKIRKSLGRGISGCALTLAFIIFLAAYGTVTLWTSSITRAILLVYSKLAADKLERRYDMLSAVSIINIAMLIYRPYIIFSSGFQMSFLSAYSISIIVPRLRGILAKLPGALIMPLGVQGLMLPYMIWKFNQVSIIGIISNILVVYLASIYVPIGVASFSGSMIIGESIAGTVGGLIGGRSGLMFMSGKLLSSLGGMIAWIDERIYSDGLFSFTLPSPDIFFVAFYMLLAVIISSEAFMVFLERTKTNAIKSTVSSIPISSTIKASAKVLPLAVALLAAIVMALIPSLALSAIESTGFSRASMVFIDVGQGDSVHLKWRGSTDILIDGGGRYNYNVGEKVLKQYLLKNGAKDVDLAMSTHEHMDHYKGITELSQCFDVKEILTEGIAGDIISFDDQMAGEDDNPNARYIELLWPIPKYDGIDDENYYSRIFMIHDRGIKTLITGDITEEGEMALLEEYRGTDKLKCDILKVAHHGSRFSSSVEFIEEVNPLVAVISVGKNNNYGHPSSEVIEKLEDSGIIVFRTDIDGAVGIVPLHSWNNRAANNRKDNNREDITNRAKFQVITQKTKRKEVF